MKFLCRPIFILILLTIVQVQAADAPRTINWDNLLPEMTPLDYPFETLTDEQFLDLEFLINIRNCQRQRDNLRCR